MHVSIQTWTSQRWVAALLFKQRIRTEGQCSLSLQCGLEKLKPGSHTETHTLCHPVIKSPRLLLLYTIFALAHAQSGTRAGVRLTADAVKVSLRQAEESDLPVHLPSPSPAETEGSKHQHLSKPSHNTVTIMHQNKQCLCAAPQGFSVQYLNDKSALITHEGSCEISFSHFCLNLHTLKGRIIQTSHEIDHRVKPDYKKNSIFSGNSTLKKLEHLELYYSKK